MYKVFRSGQPLSVTELTGRQPGRGKCRCSMRQGGVVDIRIAYPYSLYFSDQLSCIKFFDPIYVLKDIDFISLINFKTLKILFYLIIILLIIKSINNSF